MRNLAENFKAHYKRLDVLVNNAGLVTHERELSEDGFELMFAVNYLAPFLLTNLLLDVVKESAPARIVNVASMSYKWGKIDFDDLQSEQDFDYRIFPHVSAAHYFGGRHQLADQSGRTDQCQLATGAGTVRRRYGRLWHLYGTKSRPASAHETTFSAATAASHNYRGLQSTLHRYQT